MVDAQPCALTAHFFLSFRCDCVVTALDNRIPFQNHRLYLGDLSCHASQIEQRPSALWTFLRSERPANALLRTVYRSVTVCEPENELPSGSWGRKLMGTLHMGPPAHAVLHIDLAAREISTVDHDKATLVAKVCTIKLWWPCRAHDPGILCASDAAYPGKLLLASSAAV